MPDAQMRSFAEKSGHSMADIERYWDDSKKEALKKFGSKKDKSFWPYVVAIVERRAGLRKGKVKESLTFSAFMLLEAKTKFRVSGTAGINSWEYEISADDEDEAYDLGVAKATKKYDYGSDKIENVHVEPLQKYNSRKQAALDDGEYL
jgi:hypothetical protein